MVFNEDAILMSFLDIYEDDEPMSRRQIVADVGIARDESRTSAARRSTLVEPPRRELSEEIEIFQECRADSPSVRRDSRIGQTTSFDYGR